MSHEVETMAWSGQTPWHGLGYQVSNDLTPVQMMSKSKTHWTVSKKPACIFIGDEWVETGKSGLVRDSDNKILDVISDDWEPTQNKVAFEFFREFVEAGQMSMETAGSLNGGKNVWALAKINASFEAVRGDVIQSYLLFSNPHQYGRAITVRFTPIRVVCHNTLTFALSSNPGQDLSVSVNHRQKFDPDAVKGTLKIADMKLDSYKETAQFLASKRFDDESVKKYLREVFPMSTAYAEKKGNVKTAEQLLELSKPAELIYGALNTQPGVEFAEGSWWQVFNAVTFSTDHLMGRKQDTRLQSTWFGINKDRKLKALNKAVQYAEAA